MYHWTLKKFVVYQGGQQSKCEIQGVESSEYGFLGLKDWRREQERKGDGAMGRLIHGEFHFL